MPPRLSKRQQRELEELEALQKPTENDDNIPLNEEAEDVPVKTKPAAGFSAVRW